MKRDDNRACSAGGDSTDRRDPEQEGMTTALEKHKIILMVNKP
jgi:hypothetical protein